MRRMAGVLTLLLASAWFGWAQAPTPTETPHHPVYFLRKSVGFIRVTYRDGDAVGQAAGTCFFVSLEDKRLGENQGFVYLVTNRHIIEPRPGGRVVRVISVHIRLNLKQPIGGSDSAEIQVSPQPGMKWYFSPDESVDLAILPFAPDPNVFDVVFIPSFLFATSEVLKSEAVSEGDSLLFTGWFYQFPGQSKNQPIVRHGILAMMPEEKLQTTMGGYGRLYLAELHAFQGNSGSPVFINLAGQRPTGFSPGFRFLLFGVVSGYVIETQDFRVALSTTLTGELQANSGVATVVPTDELKKIIDLPELQALRDAAVARLVPKK